MAVGRNADVDDITSSAHRHLCPPPPPPAQDREWRQKTEKDGKKREWRATKKKEKKSGRKELGWRETIVESFLSSLPFLFYRFPWTFIQFQWLAPVFGNARSRHSIMSASSIRMWYELLSFSFPDFLCTIELNARGACIVKSQSTIRKVSFQSQARILTRIESEYMFVAAVGKNSGTKKRRRKTQQQQQRRASTVIISAEIRKRGSQT